MPDIVIDAATVGNQARGMRSIVFVSQMVGYAFVDATNADFYYVKTTDGGKTWGSEVSISGADTIFAFDVWYDQWTPGNTGRDIHIFWFGTAADAPSHRRLNTTNDVLSNTVLILDGATAVEGRGVFITGTRARGGNLYCGFNIDAFAETGLYRSTDNGVTWTVRTQPLEADLDQYMLYPANAVDPQDVWMIYDDDSTTELTVKTHDDSANSNSESAALTFNNNASDAVGQYGFDGSIRHSDNHLILAYVDAYDAAGASDFKVYDFDGTTLTALTDIATNVDDIYYPSVFLNQDQPDWIYVAYVGLTSGAEALGTGVGVYYARSKDRGLTWTKDIPYSTSVTDYRQSWAPLNGERFLVAFTDISGTDLMTNQDNSIEFGFTRLNNYQFAKATGQNNTGIISVTEKIK